ncbi:MAG: queuosine precursor transporter [Rhodospirillaceae bacterium]|nr:queuosine precursor transporter [Rhodospirillaceae bacterium]MBT6118720.1 queuosine precursor transporter [Rhodospirillaceae bacterium]
MSPQSGNPQPEPISAQARHSHWFVIVAAVFVTCLIISNIVAVKLISVEGVVVTAAITIFPISYIIGDVLTEVYGYRQARRVIWLGFGCNLIAAAAIMIGQWLPAASFWQGQNAYETILGYAPRLLLASFTAYLIGEFANAYILAKMKIMTRGRWLWTRTIGSTIVGQGLDSVVFATVAFIGVIPFDALLLTIVSQWLIKTAYETLATPFTYLVIGFLKRREKLDVYDRDTDFNPVAIG